MFNKQEEDMDINCGVIVDARQHPGSRREFFR